MADYERTNIRRVRKIRFGRERQLAVTGLIVLSIAYAVIKYLAFHAR